MAWSRDEMAERAAQELGHEFVGKELDEAMAKMDANGDGEIGSADLLEFLVAFGAACSDL